MSPRNSSGSYSLPSGPVVPGTTVSTVWANNTLSDASVEFTDSLSRSGKGPMLAQLRNVDGTAAAPAVAFTAEPASGLYRAGANDVRLAVGGVDSMLFVGGGIANGITMVSGQTQVKVTSPGGWLLLTGNQVAGAPLANPADVVANSTATRTAGALFEVQNNGTRKVLVDWQGLLQLTNATAIQPATIWTAITPGAGWTAGGGLAYWKDSDGIVHFKGNVTGALGSATFTTLPAGFRPASTRAYSIPWGGTAPPAANDGFYFCQVLSNGVVSAPVNSAGTIWYFDGVSFLAEA